MMSPPAFWENPPGKPGWQAVALSPFSALYTRATARRVARPHVLRPACPVICVGNINVGGTGKSPTVIALIEKLSHVSVHVVSRGYGGSEPGPLRVDERKHSASQVGDEPLLLAAFAPTWVAKDRAEGARAAEAAGADVIILDDGHQNPTIAKDLSIIVVDAASGFGNGRVLPAGPLREPVTAGLARGDLLLSIGDQAGQSTFSATWGKAITLPHTTAHLEPLQTGMDWTGLRAMAFAGIGKPEKFFATLRALGAELIREEALADHATLSDALMKRLEMEAKALSAQLVTTEKDAVRLPVRFRQKVLTLPVRLRFDKAEPLEDALSRLGLT